MPELELTIPTVPVEMTDELEEIEAAYAALVDLYS